MTSFFGELRRRNVFKVAVAYAIVGWLLTQIADVALPALLLPDWIFRAFIVLVALGFPLALVLAWAFDLTPEGVKRAQDIPLSSDVSPAKGRKLDFAIIAALVLALGFVVVDQYVLEESGQAAPIDAFASLAEVRDLVGESRFAVAYGRALKLDPVFTDASLREALWDTVSVLVNLTSDPPGAEVWMRPYNSAEEDWEHLGRTPLEDARLSRGMVRLRLEREGYRTLSAAARVRRQGSKSTFLLDPTTSLPEGMVRVPGEEFEAVMPGLEHLWIELPDYLIDTTETTNRDYKRFVDAGGYSNPEYWEHQFVQEGRALPFEDAMDLFKDRTGRSGPSTWEVGTYPDALADHPVAGVSWYEAAAYARFMGKQLPTLYHWYLAASPGRSQFILPRSNFGGEGTAAVGTYDGISQFGVFDVAGNVREWIWNQSDDGGHFLLGGSWSDQEYMFTDGNAESAFDRSEANGLRLMVALDNENLALAQEPIFRTTRDYLTERPVSDEIFDVYRRLYAYDATPLNSVLIAREEVEYWAREEIELDAAYGNERLTVFLYLPRDAEPSYPPIVYFPGSNVIYQRESFPADDFELPFLIRSGHAVLYPVYKGTFERGTELATDIQNETSLYREHVIQWSKDLGRSLDYLETRPDITMDRLGYVGLSWGAAIAPVMIAVEPRLKASVLISGGLTLQPTQPEVDPFNFLPRVKIPTRMINVPDDFYFPLESSQGPFYDSLGVELKDRVLLEGAQGGHVPPMNFVARETLDWFDQYLAQAP